ncbi:hypothetical protein LguiB_023567 [Lonicera macranthoides]
MNQILTQQWEALGSSGLHFYKRALFNQIICVGVIYLGRRVIERFGIGKF